jgi:hypothetical protein
MVFPHYNPSLLPRIMVLINFDLHYVRKLSCKSELPWPMVLEKKDF